jgi:hypothetical protein
LHFEAQNIFARQSTRGRRVPQQYSFEVAKAKLVRFSAEHHGLRISALRHRGKRGTILDETDSLKASRISLRRSLGKARATLSLWRQEIPVAANLAF